MEQCRILSYTTLLHCILLKALKSFFWNLGPPFFLVSGPCKVVHDWVSFSEQFLSTTVWLNIWQFCNQITFEFLLFPKSTNFVLGEEGSILLLTVLSILPSSLLVQSWIKRKNEKFKSYLGNVWGKFGSYLGNVWGKFGSYLEDIRTKPKILVWSKF